MTYIDGTPDYMDSRDLIERLDDLLAQDSLDADERELRQAIIVLANEGIEGWEYGAQFIRHDCFTEYAQELAEDIGAIGPASWPNTCIDWEWAARELKHDYTTIEYLGQTYYVR